MPAVYETEVSLGQAIFGNAQLGDQRRTWRLVQTFDLMRRHPGGTLPDKLASPADLRAFYRLCDCDDVTHAKVIEAARQHTFTRIAACQGAVLLVHDATELDYTTLTSLVDDLGQIGKGSRRGYVCQNVLAVEADTGDVLGLLDQVLHHRDEAPDGETLTELRERDTRESLLWLRGTEHLPADAKLIDVSDQGSDTFEYLEHEFKSGRRFVIRACKVRKVYGGHTEAGPRRYLKEHADSLPELGRFTMDVQAQDGRQERKAAEFTLRGGPVLVSEVTPPAGEKAVQWMLLTNEPVQAFEDAWRVTGWYEKRWIVEELHKAKKTGCQIEDLQFTTTARLEPAIALLSVVAVTLLNLREASRRPDAKTRFSSTLFAVQYVEVLSHWRYRKIRPELTVHDFFYALARLGGHQNRKCDHRPGWLVLWRGWTKLQAMLDGYDAALQIKCGKT